MQRAILYVRWIENPQETESKLYRKEAQLPSLPEVGQELSDPALRTYSPGRVTQVREHEAGAAVYLGDIVAYALSEEQRVAWPKRAVDGGWNVAAEGLPADWV